MKSPLIPRAKALRRNMTPHEAKVWVCLRAWRVDGLKFRRQVPLGPYIVDFACFHPKVVMEIDGGQHALDGHAARDAQRDTWLRGQGFVVFRAWNFEVHADVDAVMEGLRAVIDAARGGAA
jgi:very-short-patch-repair endonuclease